jgi:hypothetical protein
VKYKRRRKRGNSTNSSNNRDEKKNRGFEYPKNNDTLTSPLASVLSFWQQQYFPMRWNETYNEYVTYAKRMAQINEEFVTRSQRMAQLYIELSENAQRINELFKESIEITEAAYRNWLNTCYSFWNGNISRSLLSSAIEKNEKVNEKITAKKEDANLTQEEQKSINNMFKDSLTFD